MAGIGRTTGDRSKRLTKDDRRVETENSPAKKERIGEQVLEQEQK